MSHKESLEAKKQMLMFTLTNRQLHGWSHGFQWLNQPKQNEWTPRPLSDMCSNLIIFLPYTKGWQKRKHITPIEDFKTMLATRWVQLKFFSYTSKHVK